MYMIVLVPLPGFTQAVFLPRGDTGYTISGGVSGNDDATVVNGSFAGVTNGWFEMGGVVSRLIRPGNASSYWTYSLYGSVYPLRRDIQITPITIGLSAAYTGIIAPAAPDIAFSDSHVYSGSLDVYLDAELAARSILQPMLSAMVLHTTDPDNTDWTAGIGLTYINQSVRHTISQGSNRAFHVCALVVFPKSDIPFTFGIQVGVSTWWLK